VKTLPCRVERMEKLAGDVMAVWLKLPSNERLQFLPGQYLDFLLKDGTRRSFSLANAPEEDELLELHIRHVPGGRFTEQVFSSMKAKDIMRINGPHGSFFLRDSDKPAIFVAGGTGFAPIKSILAHAFHHEIDRQFVFYWGARDLASLYLPQVPSDWQQKHANFTFIPVIDQVDGDWAGRTGRVHEAVLDDFEDLSGFEAYVCGAPVMVQAAKRAFLARGLADDAFFSDAFDYQSA
jgi:CDP-4-dehydro-6-deoxyglucose reductase